MKVKVEFIGLPELRRLIGSKETTVTLRGSTIGDLLDELKRLYGNLVKDHLLDQQGKIQGVIQVIRNGKEWLARDNPMTELRDGDRITFLLMVAGG